MKCIAPEDRAEGVLGASLPDHLRSVIEFFN